MTTCWNIGVHVREEKSRVHSRGSGACGWFRRRVVPVTLALTQLGSLGMLATGCKTRFDDSGARQRQAKAPQLFEIPPLVIKGKVVEATSPYLTSDGQPRNNLVKQNLQIPAEQWGMKKANFTEAMYQLGMDFLAKDPETGAYNVPHAVPVEPMVVQMERSWLNEYAKSTKWWLKTCRKLMQVVYTHKNPTLEQTKSKLGIEGNKHDVLISEVLEIMKNSDYRYPAFVSESMADYPFLAITGWDAIISDFDKVEGMNFEVNAGTPSGISNLTAILEHFERWDPDQYEALKDFIHKDDTFVQMRKVIELSGEAWTGRKNGIGVVIGPGIFNGAHPDVATISTLTGMPLVHINDLKVGEDGFLYLERGAGQSDVLVTSVYSRMEESYLFQEGSVLSEYAIPLSQTFIRNDKLSEKFGIKLKKDVWYQYLYDDSGKITGVKTDPTTKEPLLELSQNQMLSAERSRGQTILSLVRDKKLFVNHIGGRMIDDKQLFKSIFDIAQVIYPNRTVAGPAYTLSKSEYDQLKEEPENYVIKETVGSGGDKVYVLRTLSGERQKKRIQEFFSSEGQGYTVQRFTPSISQPTVKKMRGGWEFKQLLGDLRIYVNFFPNGTVYTGNRGFLYRVAPFDTDMPKDKAGVEAWSLGKANTSLGGGYGIMVVKDNRKVPPLKAAALISSVQSKKFLNLFLQELSSVSKKVASSSAISKEELKSLANRHKEVMHLLGWKSSRIRIWADQVRIGKQKDQVNAWLRAVATFVNAFPEINARLTDLRLGPDDCRQKILARAQAYSVHDLACLRAVPFGQ